MSPKDEDRIANTEDPGQTAPREADPDQTAPQEAV